MKEPLKLATGEELFLRPAREEDMVNLKRLYFDVYGGRYTLPEVTDRDKMKWVIHDPNYLWLLACEKKELVGAIIFVVDRKHRVGKSMAAVVASRFQGKHVMQSLMQRGLRYLMEEKDWCDLQYAVVRTVSVAPQKMLAKLGFVGLGVFPNVRRIKGYETHGLAALFKSKALAARRRTPILIPPVEEIFRVTSSLLSLGKARVHQIAPHARPLRIPTPWGRSRRRKGKGGEPASKPPMAGGGEVEFLIERSKEVEWEYYRLRDAGDLVAEFFPFHYPNVKLHTRDHKTEVFLNFQEVDGHADLLGVKTDRPDLAGLLLRVGEYAESMGVKYLETLVSAYDPALQHAAYRAHFLPCAYFPAFRMGEERERLDYVVMFRSFVPLGFGGLKLTDKTKPYLVAFYKIYTRRLMEEIEAGG